MWDVIIVGGGPAGLSAALVLGRCRRKVLLCDAGKPRNAKSAAMHGFLSRDGIAPAEFLGICREQLGQYPGVELHWGEVTSAEKIDGLFHVVVEDEFTAQADKLLLATGIEDVLPEIPGFQQFYGKTIHHCPYCDGWEHRDQSLGVFGGGPREAELAIELINWSKDLVVFSNGPAPAKVKEQLAMHRILLEEAPVGGCEGQGERLRGVRLLDGRFLERQALFFYPQQRQRSELAKGLGCRFTTDETIECSEGTQTSVPGLYVAGNASRGLQLAIIAAAEGTHAAFSINEALASEPRRALV